MDTICVKIDLNDELENLLPEAEKNPVSSTGYFKDAWGKRHFENVSRGQRYKSFLDKGDSRAFFTQSFREQHYGQILFTAHLSQFSSFATFYEFLKENLSRLWSQQILDSPLTRLDLALDTNLLTMNQAYEGLHKYKARKGREFSSNSKTVYLGGQRAYVCIYEKDNGIRFEDRKFGSSRVPYSCLRDLIQNDPKQLYPFSSLRYEEPLKDRMRDGLNEKQKIKALELIVDIQSKGLFLARKEHNKSNNFSRTLDSLFRPSKNNLMKTLEEQWVAHCQNYFNGGIDGRM